MKIIHNTLIFTSITIMSISTPTFSQEEPNKNKTTHTKSISVGVGFPEDALPFQAKIGLGIGLFPKYEGADSYNAVALPLANIKKPGSYFLEGAGINTNNGLASAGFTLLHLSYFKNSERHMLLTIGPVFRAYGGRNENYSKALDGMGDIDSSVSLGSFIKLNVGNWLANISVIPQNVGNNTDGTLATFDIEHTQKIKKYLKLTTGFSTSWGDRDYMQGYFGVNNAQASQSEFSRFDSQSGFKDVGIQMKASYAISPHWSLDGQIGYWRHLNSAANSPIIKNKGSVDQIRGLAGFSYLF